METFQVILEGQCLAGFDPADVRTALAKLVGQTEAVAGQLLAAREVVVKSRVDIVTSTRYVEALRSIGVASRVAPEVLQLDDDLASRLNVKPTMRAAGRGDEHKQQAIAVGSPSVSSKTAPNLDAATLAWPRLWARQIDIALCWAITLGVAVLVGSTHLLAAPSTFVQWALVFLLVVFVFLGYETLSLGAFGTTLGKAALGLRVETQTGTKIKFGRALRRTLGVLLIGCGSYRGWRSYRRLRKTGSTIWDDSCATRVAGGPVALWRVTLAGVIAITALWLVIGLGAIDWSEMTPQARSTGVSPTPAATAAPSSPKDCTGSFADLDPACPQYKPTQAATAAPSNKLTPPDACDGFFAGTTPGCPQYAARQAAILAADPNPADAKAQNNLGVMYDNGQGVAQDYAEAVKWFRKAADQGDAYAQKNLGGMYDKGHGVPQDYAEAIKWYRKAADQGAVKAQGNLGFMYDNGHGVPQDYAEAARWYRKAADQGDVIAQANLGGMYYNGRGVAQDYAEAARWYRKAADQGDAWAQDILGGMYANGQGVSPDNAEAYKLFELAAARFPASETKLVAETVKNREILATRMTPAQIAEAQMLAREWRPQ